MHFLKDVPQQYHVSVTFILEDENIDVETKLSILRGMDLMETVIAEAAEYLTPKVEELTEEENHDDDIEVIDFRDLLPQSKRTVVDILVEKKKWTQLTKYISVESAEVQQAFDAFMRRTEENAGGVVMNHDPPVTEGKRQMEGEKNSTTSETSSVEQTTNPSSFNVQQSSLDSQREDSPNSQETRELAEENASLKERIRQLEKEAKQKEIETARLQKKREDEDRHSAEVEKLVELARIKKQKQETATREAELEKMLYNGPEKQKDNPKAVQPKIDEISESYNSKINLQFTEDFPKEMNIVILGGTGVGKSSFMNAFVNYFKYGEMNQARANGVEVLVKTAFSQVDKDLNNVRIVCKPTIVNPHDQDDNEDETPGNSSTQMPKAYAFNWGTEDDPKIIRFIDTPGIGDSRGVEQDKINFSNILSFIADYPEIHAILILLKPNNAKLTVSFRFCIFELLTHLHVSARNNIMFCFTNSRQTLYVPGETLPALEKLMEELEKKRGFRVPLNKGNIFCFDSESYRFLCAWGRGIRFSDEEETNFAQSWAISVDETFRLLHCIKELHPHQVQNTLSVNNVRAIIFALSPHIATLLRNIEHNRIIVESKLKEIQDLLKEKGDLDKLDPYVEQVDVVAKELDFPMTVCAGPNCFEKKKFSNRPDEIECIVYKQKCHDHCYLFGIKENNFPNHLIKKCACFGCGKHPDRCSDCDCPWNTHLHVTVDVTYTTKTIIDEDVKKSRDNNENKQKTAELAHLTATKKLRDLEEQSTKICNYCSEFAAFVNANSLVAYHDVYLEYVDFLIREEDMKISNGASDRMRSRLLDSRRHYEETIERLRNPKKANSKKTVEEIMDMLEELKNLPNGGDFLRAVEKLELRSVRQQQVNSVTNITLKSEYFSKML